MSFPSVGEPALVPSAEQLRAIAQTTGANARVSIGVSPLAGDVEVRVDPDRIFGRHLAVLGNTGSGKSCTVAGLVRWSLEAARKAMTAAPTASAAGPNARFIVLDPNGEYGSCFHDVAGVRVFRPVAGPDAEQLTVPGWVWSSAEWAAISRASLQTQRPLLQQSLRNLRNSIDVDTSSAAWLAQRARGFLSMWTGIEADPTAYGAFPKFKSVDQALESALVMLETAREGGQQDIVEPAISALTEVGKSHLPRFSVQYPGAYNLGEVQQIIQALRGVCEQTVDHAAPAAVSEDAPMRFDLDALPDHLAALSQTADFAGGATHASYLIARIRTMLTDSRLRSIVCPDTGQDFADWLADLLGNEQNGNSHVAIIDLSLLASDVVHTVVAVLARVVMEALQQVRRQTKTLLPTVLVLEEAHNFVGRDNLVAEIPTTRDLCRETFERISREGRKFGLGLVLSSQRPSELSATVLSQCNSFLLHRLVNDRDQDLVARLIPDTLGDLLRELPSLPSRHAVLLGWATPVPTLVEIRELPVEQRPHSPDPQFWDTWTRGITVDFAWGDIAATWLSPTREEE